MSDFLPPQPTPTDAVYALLQVLTDPAAHKAKLDELKAQAEGSHQVLLAAQAAQSQAEALHKALDEKRADLASYENELHTRADQIDRQHRDLAERENNLAAARKEHARAMDDLAVATKAHEQRDIDIDTREGAVAEKERHAAQLFADAEARQQAAETLRADYQDRIAKFKALAG